MVTRLSVGARNLPQRHNDNTIQNTGSIEQFYQPAYLLGYNRTSHLLRAGCHYLG
jgi:hypothetical protein